MPEDRPNLPLVSVVIPTHRRPDQLRRAIESVVSQDYEGVIECIVVHDGEPADRSLCSQDSRRPVVVLENTNHSRGLPGARNAGLDAVNGDFVASLDDDDRWFPDKLRRQLELFSRQPDALAIASGIVVAAPGGATQDRQAPDVLMREQLLTSRVPQYHSSNLLMKRETFTRCGRYDESMPIAEDYDWLLRLTAEGPVLAVPEPLVWIDRSRPMWAAARWNDWAVGRERLLNKHPELASTPHGAASIYGRIAFAHAARGDRRQATRWIVRSVRRGRLGRWGLTATVVLLGVPVRWVQVVYGRAGRSV